jgi:hypothetical protein
MNLVPDCGWVFVRCLALSIKRFMIVSSNFIEDKKR